MVYVPSKIPNMLAIRFSGGVITCWRQHSNIERIFFHTLFVCSPFLKVGIQRMRAQMCARENKCLWWQQKICWVIIFQPGFSERGLVWVLQEDFHSEVFRESSIMYEYSESPQLPPYIICYSTACSRIIWRRRRIGWNLLLGVSESLRT